MEKTCTLTYGEALDKGIQVVNIEGLISLCPPYGAAFAKPMNLMLNTIILRKQRDDLEYQFMKADLDLINSATKEDKAKHLQIKMESEALIEVLDVMIKLNKMEYKRDDLLDETMSNVLLDSLASISDKVSLATGVAGIAKSDIKTVIGMNHQVEGGNRDDILTGCSQEDTLIGSAGDDILWHSKNGVEDFKRDVLNGGSGFDTYHAGDGDVIIDSDGNGKIFFSGMSLNMTATYNEKGGVYENGDYQFHLILGRVLVHNTATGKSILIDSPNLANDETGQTVYSGLGLTLHKKKKEEEPQDPSNPDSGDGSGSGVCTGSTGCTCGTCKPPCTGTDDCDCGECSNKKETEADPVNPDGGTTTTAPAVRSPIIFDLDGDASNNLIDLINSETYFDVNGWDIAKRTGWVSPSDGLLVWDANDNGKIDNISELFGNDNYSNGFEKLKTLFDSNKDRVIDATDINFDKLKIWVDFNSDGVSQSWELISLSDLGIKSINLNYTRLNGTKGGESIANSTYTNADGTTGGAYDYLFDYEVNGGNYKGDHTITDEIRSLISNFQGTGLVKDLHVAMALDKELFNFVRDKMKNSQDMSANFDEFMLKWTGLEKKHKELGINTNGVLRLVDIVWIINIRNGENFITDQELINGRANQCYSDSGNRELFNKMRGTYTQFMLILESYKGVEYSVESDRLVIKNINEFISSLNSKSNLQDVIPLFMSVKHFSNFNSSGAYAFLSNSRWWYVLDKEIIVGTDDNETIAGAAQNNLIIGGKGNDNLYGGGGNDTYIFNRGDGVDIINDTSGTADKILFGEGITLEDLEIVANNTNNSITIGMKEVGKTFAEYSDKLTLNYLLYNNDVFGRGVIEQFEFSDGSVIGIEELLSRFGTSGNDSLIWGASKLNVNMGDGNDYVSAGNFDDVIAGGKGNDNLYGGGGNDTYIFNRGDGVDTIIDNSGTADKILFGEGITLEDLEIVANNTNNSITIGIKEFGKTFAEYSDKLTLNYLLYNNDVFGRGVIEQFEFSDGSVIGIEELLSRFGTSGNDSLIWGASKLNVNMGDGNDYVSAGNFDDVIAGGKGNDNLYGGGGNDTYIFNRGDGVDTIIDNSGTADKILFGEGITLEDLEIVANNTNNSITIGIKEFGKTFAEYSDKLTLNYLLYNNDVFGRGVIEQFEFSDGSVIGIEELLSRFGTSGNDSLIWGASKLNVNMGDGNDYVSAGNFDDVIAGGKGNDNLYGGGGNDTYIFNRGDGVDIINDTSGDGDKIVFGDINADEFGIYFHSYRNNMQISYGDSNTDVINVINNSVERFEFADGSYLIKDDINYLIQQISAFSRDNGVNFGDANAVRMNEQFNQVIVNQLRRDF